MYWCAVHEPSTARRVRLSANTLPPTVVAESASAVRAAPQRAQVAILPPPAQENVTRATQRHRGACVRSARSMSACAAPRTLLPPLSRPDPRPAFARPVPRVRNEAKQIDIDPFRTGTTRCQREQIERLRSIGRVGWKRLVGAACPPIRATRCGRDGTAIDVPGPARAHHVAAPASRLRASAAFSRVLNGNQFRPAAAMRWHSGVRRAGGGNQPFRPRPVVHHASSRRQSPRRNAPAVSVCATGDRCPRGVRYAAISTPANEQSEIQAISISASAERVRATRR